MRIKDEIFCFAHLHWCHNGWASNILIVVDTIYYILYQNIGCPSIMTPSKMGKTKNLIFYSQSNKSRLVRIILESIVILCGSVTEFSSRKWEARGSIPDKTWFSPLNLVWASWLLLHLQVSIIISLTCIVHSNPCLHCLMSSIVFYAMPRWSI